MSLLEVKNLHTYFKTKKGIVKAVNDVTYSLEAGKTLGIVGESGSGKSVSAMSIIKLLDGNGWIDSGSVTRTYEAGLTGYEPDGETVLLAGDSVTLQALGEGNYTVLRDYGDLFWDVRMNINDLTNNFTEYFILPAAPTYGVGRNP